MGKPEECAGLLRMGYNPSAISAVLGISTLSVIDYLYRAVGRQYVSSADIVLSIPTDLRNAAEEAIASINTDHWLAVLLCLELSLEHFDGELLRLYLHLRGTVLGDFYFHIIAVERALFGLVKSRADSTFQYKYFRDLVKAIERNPSILADVLTLSSDGLAHLRRANGLRNRVMHAFPPFSPSDADFRFIRDLHHTLSLLGKEEPTPDDSDKLRRAGELALSRAQERSQAASSSGDA